MSRSTLNRSLIVETHPGSAISEAFRGLRTNLEFSGGGEEYRTVSVTSSLRGEGKSTTAANLAVTYAKANRRVLIVDADLRKPALHELFGLPNRLGLSNALMKHGKLDEVIQRTNVANLSAVTAGPIPPNPSEMLDSDAFSALLQAAKEQFDLVIVDTPPVTDLSDGLVVASRCDGVVLVMKAGRVKNETALKAKAALDYGKAKIIGAVLTNVNR
ncbi:CpsD/CapB family tyrosine-protein kinase [Paenibacillus sp. MWE-103]|uniref:non-specific protein-tyrosine kinase n=1 Tax=Paenibacillus artemisiicola TaxID=1172618 RepID=A0ABS3W9G3_9BACL|nr:CpsD/CapB family tyrosine-protein kinase [Paenibacillus artemisiicola]MBO7744913.1 CpsD/CapB family tyrosine-protein kinase [Paenibacillus artemisiicola]